MALLDIVRQRMGIYYQDPAKDAELQQLIAEAKADLISSGWPESEMTEGSEAEMAITAIVVHCQLSVGDIDEARAVRILIGLQTKASLRKARLQDEADQN